ncbi:NAD(P)H nitroreductase [Bacillus pseudomycoides]|nr:NAD(P)H nitroreductase [Bacillus pseudomycoides]
MISTIESTIVSRRTIRVTKQTPIPLQEVEDLLEKAAYAPFHSKVEPWSVTIVSTEEEKKYFLDCVMKSYERTGVFSSYSEEQLNKVRGAYEKYSEATPLTLLVVTDRFEDEHKYFESVGATCAFIQNLQLLCWEKNIGAVWRTNSYIHDPIFANELGIPSSKKIIGSIDLGYIDEEKVPRAKQRRPVNEWVNSLSIHPKE